MTEMQAWLAGLNAGDVVILGRMGSLTTATVTRTTATQILVGGTRYRRDSGRQVAANTWSGSSLVEPTPDRLGVARHQELLRRVEAVRWVDVSRETLEAVVAALRIGAV